MTFFFLAGGSNRGRIQGGGDSSSALRILPDKLKTELALHVNLATLKKVNSRWNGFELISIIIELAGVDISRVPTRVPARPGPEDAGVHLHAGRHDLPAR